MTMYMYVRALHGLHPHGTLVHTAIKVELHTQLMCSGFDDLLYQCPPQSPIEHPHYINLLHVPQPFRYFLLAVRTRKGRHGLLTMLYLFIKVGNPSSGTELSVDVQGSSSYRIGTEFQ